jgi:NADH dehydrogenase (ubiquinone) 1 alpha subcomplex subunit 9
MLQDDSSASQTFELYGPKNYSMAEIAELVDKEILKHRRHINLPKAILKPAANLLNRLLWWPVVSADEVEREFINQKIDPDAKTFKDVGIEPAELSSLTFHYLVSVHPLAKYKPIPDASTARVPQLCILRSTTGNRTREARGKEILACYR